MYTNTAESNLEEIEESINIVKDHLDLLKQMFHQFDASDYYQGTELERLNCLRNAAEFAQVTQKVEKR